VEECIGNASPSWGYIYLANLIYNNYFNVVFTTNFDDLLNEACFTYTNLKPIVCAHDSSVVDIRITSSRPKIIKLHGDFLYDNIKNTLKETDTLEINIKDKLLQFGREYGLIVFGYGGNDDSVMDVLNMMVKNKGFFPHGIYWCVRKKEKGEKYNSKLLNLLQKDRIYLVEIDGFDEFMAELHDYIKVSLPDIINDPYKTIFKNFNKFISPPMSNLSNQIIKRDAEILEQKIKQFEQDVLAKKIEEMEKYIPYGYLGSQEYQKHNYERAIFYFEKENNIETNLSNISNLISSYLYFGKYEESKKVIDKLILSHPDYYRGYYYSHIFYKVKNDETKALEYIDTAIAKSKDNSEKSILLHYKITTCQFFNKIDEAYNLLNDYIKTYSEDEAAKVTKYSILSRKGDITQYMDEIKTYIQSIKGDYNKACIYAVIKNKEQVISFLEKCIMEDSRYKFTAKYDPDFYNYKDDSDFKKLIT